MLRPLQGENITSSLHLAAPPLPLLLGAPSPEQHSPHAFLAIMDADTEEAQVNGCNPSGKRSASQIMEHDEDEQPMELIPSPSQPSSSKKAKKVLPALWPPGWVEKYQAFSTNTKDVAARAPYS